MVKCSYIWFIANSNLNVGKLTILKKCMDAKNVPFDDRHIIIHANSLSGLLGMREQSHSDFNSIKNAVSEINTFLGFRFYVLGDRDEGGLPLATNDRTCFAFHRECSRYEVIWHKLRSTMYQKKHLSW